MKKTVLHEFCSIFTTHQNDNLFPWQSLSHHLDTWFSLRIVVDYVLNLVNFFISRAGKASLILMTSDVLVPCLEACVYDFGGCLVMLASLIFLKYLEICLTSFCDLVGIDREIFLILTEIGLSMNLLFLLETGGIFGVNFAKIFCLKVFKFLLMINKFYLDW